MKKIIMYIIMAVLTFGTTIAQSFTQKGKSFISQSATAENSSTKTSYTWVDTDKKEYSIYISSRGKAYIIRTSKKSGKEYKKYLPDEIANSIMASDEFKKQKKDEQKKL